MNSVDEINLSRSLNELTLKDVHTFIQLTRSVTRSIQLNLNEIRIKLIGQWRQRIQSPGETDGKRLWMNGILRCNNNDTCRFALYCDEFAAHRWAGPTLQLIPAESNRLSANGRLFYSFPAVPVEYLALFLFVSDAIVSTCLMAFFFYAAPFAGQLNESVRLAAAHFSIFFSKQMLREYVAFRPEHILYSH